MLGPVCLLTEIAAYYLDTNNFIAAQENLNNQRVGLISNNTTVFAPSNSIFLNAEVVLVFFWHVVSSHFDPKNSTGCHTHTHTHTHTDISPVSWVCWITEPLLRREVRPSSECHRYDTKSTNVEAPVLDLWRLCITHLLPSLPDQFWPELVVAFTFLSVDQIKCLTISLHVNKWLLFNWIVYSKWQYLKTFYSIQNICLNFWDEHQWFPSIGVLRLLFSSLLFYSQRFGRYVLNRFLSEPEAYIELRTTSFITRLQSELNLQLPDDGLFWRFGNQFL